MNCEHLKIKSYFCVRTKEITELFKTSFCMLFIVFIVCLQFFVMLCLNNFIMVYWFFNVQMFYRSNAVPQRPAVRKLTTIADDKINDSLWWCEKRSLQAFIINVRFM